MLNRNGLRIIKQTGMIEPTPICLETITVNSWLIRYLLVNELALKAGVDVEWGHNNVHDRW